MRMIHRVKAPIQPLVNQMLDQLPESVWMSDSTTFLDPAMGGGQFIREIEKRLRSAGHSDQNIASRVWGCESLNIRLKYVKNWHKVVTTNLILTDFVSYDWGNMKFDVIIGNPPYQNGNEKGGARSLWRKFVARGFDLCKDGGHVAMVTPGCPFKSSDIGGYFTNYQTLKVYTDVAKHFPGIGSTFTAWVSHKVTPYQQTEYPDLKVHVDLKTRVYDKVFDPVTESILNKIQLAKNVHGMIDCRQDKGYSSNDLHAKPEKYNVKPSAARKFKVRHASQIEYCYGTIATECHNKSKVMMTFSGYPNFKYYSSKDPVSSCYQMSGYILVKNSKQGKNLINILNLKINQFERAMINKGGFTGVDTFKHVNLDVDQSWSDDDYFDLLNLTTDERELILKMFNSNKDQ